jgi:hypothetical protein
MFLRYVAYITLLHDGVHNTFKVSTIHKFRSVYMNQKCQTRRCSCCPNLRPRKMAKYCIGYPIQPCPNTHTHTGFINIRNYSCVADWCYAPGVAFSCRLGHWVSAITRNLENTSTRSHTSTFTYMLGRVVSAKQGSLLLLICSAASLSLCLPRVTFFHYQIV